MIEDHALESISSDSRTGVWDNPIKNWKMRQVVAMDAAALLLRKWRRQTEWFYNLTFEDLPADKEDDDDFKDELHLLSDRRETFPMMMWLLWPTDYRASRMELINFKGF